MLPFSILSHFMESERTILHRCCSSADKFHPFGDHPPIPMETRAVRLEYALALLLTIVWVHEEMMRDIDEV
jgi:hypothetical protein